MNAAAPRGAPAWRRRLRLALHRRFARPRGAWGLAGPVVVQEIGLVLAGAAITLLAARLGPGAVAAIGMVDALGYLLHAAFGAMAIGATVAVAQARGAGRHDALPAIAATALLLAAGAALALSAALWATRGAWIAALMPGAEPEVARRAADYLRWLIVADVPAGVVLVGGGVLRGASRTRDAMQVQLTMNGAHVALGAVLMHGAGWDVDGAGAALVAGRVLGLVWTLHALRPLWRTRTAGTGPAWQRRHAAAILRIGWPAAVENGLFHVGKLATQSMVAGLGTGAMAANFVAFAVTALLNIPGTALGVAATTRVGLRVGAGEREAARRDLARTVRSATWALSAGAAVVAPCAGWLAGLYADAPEVVGPAALLIALNCAFMPAWAASFVLPAGLRGAGDTRYTMVVAIVGMWLFRVVLGWLLGHALGLGLVGVWLGMFTDWVVRGQLFRRRLRQPHWARAAVTR